MSRRKKRGLTDDDASSSTAPSLCSFYQSGCCMYGNACYFTHDSQKNKDANYKLILCGDFMSNGFCTNEARCHNAHGEAELRTPEWFEGFDGYKVHFCTYHLLDDLQCDKEAYECFDAHGALDRRPASLSSPPDLEYMNFTYSDAHVHLDQVLLARRYGQSWMYKRTLCRHNPCLSNACRWAHSKSEIRPRLLFDKGDLKALAEEQQSLSGGTFGGCVHVSCEVDTINETVELVSWGREILSGRLYACFGIHPSHFDDYTSEVEALIEIAIGKCGDKAVAWGECGLDYHRRQTYTEDGLKMDAEVKARMCEVFAQQARAAVRHDLPLVVHSRNAEDDTLRVLSENVPVSHAIYMHSFDCSKKTLAAFLEKWPQGYVGINGCITWDGTHGGSFTGSKACDIVSATPLSRVLLETDGPYLAPEPHTGASTHPGHIPWIAHSVAWVKGLSTAEVLSATHDNFCRFYRLSK